MRTAHFVRTMVLFVFVASSPGGLVSAQSGANPLEVAAAIDQLGAYDYAARSAASRTVRRATPAIAAPALVKAVREHKDSFVRYRALVLLSGLGDSAVADTMMSVIADRNDRLRAVVYAWLARHPSASVVPALIEALAKESSEFVRPSLTRALAAHKDDERARAAVLPLITRGDDMFRAEVIQALGDFGGLRAKEAADAILAVAKLDGPLQDDAIIAVGKLGDRSVLESLAALQRTVSRERQSSIAAAICLLGLNCDTHRKYLVDTVKFSATTPNSLFLLRSTAGALAALAARGDQEAFAALFDAGGGAPESVREVVGLALGTAAVRNPSGLLQAVGARKDQNQAVELLRDAFDMLEEDFEEEQFYVTVRRAYWDAPEGSPARRTAEAIIQKLEF
jgi:HEAT repeat protein